MCDCALPAPPLLCRLKRERVSVICEPLAEEGVVKREPREQSKSTRKGPVVSGVVEERGRLPGMGSNCRFENLWDGLVEFTAPRDVALFPSERSGLFSRFSVGVPRPEAMLLMSWGMKECWRRSFVRDVTGRRTLLTEFRKEERGEVEYAENADETGWDSEQTSGAGLDGANCVDWAEIDRLSNCVGEAGSPSSCMDEVVKSLLFGQKSTTHSTV